jgi:hypothetical protein
MLTVSDVVGTKVGATLCVGAEVGVGLGIMVGCRVGKGVIVGRLVGEVGTKEGEGVGMMDGK